MKLRIQNDSVRLRLTVSEVHRIGAGRPVVATTAFPGATLTYRLVPSGAAALCARLDGTTVTLRVPRDEARHWAQRDDRVALSGEVAVNGGATLRLLVEKDFACLAPRPGEDGTDLFANPAAQPAATVTRG